jgi:acetolactate synthase-1/2/3 large subunit
MDSAQAIGRTVAELYLHALKRRGIKYIFANSGTDFTPIVDGIAHARETGGDIPEFILVPHENVAISMANGYYETCGEMAGVMVHVTVGTANALCGLMNVSRENIPVFLAAGRSPATETGHPASRNGTVHWGQETFDQGGMVREYVKWDYELRAGQPVDAVVGRALDIAMSEPRGPVYLTLPREVLADPAVHEPLPPITRALGNSIPAPNADAIDQAVDVIAGAQNVLIVAGRPGGTPAGFRALSALAHNHAIPVAQGFYVNIPTSHPMNVGPANKALLEWADVIVVMDALVPWMPSGVSPRVGTKIIHVGTDPLYSRIPFRGFHADILIAGDSTRTIALLDSALRGKLKNKGAAVDKRRTDIAEMRARRDARQAKQIEEVRTAFPIHPIWLAHCLNEVKDKNAIVVNELGVPQPFLKYEAPNSSFGNSGAGGLGRGLGGALGAKLAAPDRQVITAVGDGAYMFGCPIAAHFVGRAQKLPTLTIINNNAEWHAVRSATLRVNPNGPASRANVMPLTSLDPSPDFEKAIESCGGIGERVEDPDKLTAALERALQHVDGGTQALVNVKTQGTRDAG